LLDLVGAVGPESDRLADQIHKLYEWHHARAVTVLQLAFAPAAVIAAIAIVAKDPPGSVKVSVAVVLVVIVAIGLWRLGELNQLHGEYVLALRLGKELLDFHAELALYLDGEPLQIGRATTDSTGPGPSVGAELYKDLGSISMVNFRSRQGEDRMKVRQTLIDKRNRS
jgi:hypothetical protein